MIEIITTIIGAGIGAFIVWKYLNKEMVLLKEVLKRYKFGIRSAYVKFGKTFEQYAPFTKNFPGDKNKFVFLGCPIDGIIFDEDKIRFIEIKTGNSMLSPKQKFIKKQIEDGKVEFREVRY